MFRPLLALCAAAVIGLGAAPSVGAHAVSSAEYFGFLYCTGGQVSTYTPTTDWRGWNGAAATAPQLFRWGGSRWESVAVGHWLWQQFGTASWLEWNTGESVGAQNWTVQSGTYAVLNWIYDYADGHWQTGVSVNLNAQWWCYA